MNRKNMIEQMLKKMESQYPADEKFTRGMEPLIEQLYAVPEKDFERILDLTRETYQRNYETKRNLEGAGAAFKDIGNNLKKMGENYQKMSDGIEQINRGLRSIVEKAPQALEQLNRNNDDLYKLKETIETHTHELNQARNLAENTEQRLTGNRLKGPKDLN